MNWWDDLSENMIRQLKTHRTPWQRLDYQLKNILSQIPTEDLRVRYKGCNYKTSVLPALRRNEYRESGGRNWRDCEEVGKLLSIPCEEESRGMGK